MPGTSELILHKIAFAAPRVPFHEDPVTLDIEKQKSPLYGAFREVDFAIRKLPPRFNWFAPLDENRVPRKVF